MWSRFSIKTAYASFSNKEVYEMSRHADNLYARIEFILRFFTCSWITRYGTIDEVKNICEVELKKNSQHNFFNYVMAQLEEDPLKKINFLSASAACATPWTTISAQAAYELSQLHYPSPGKNIIPCLAWLSHAIILGSPQACKDFLNNNLCNKNKTFNLIMIDAVFLTTHLSGKKIHGLTTSSLISNYITNRKNNSPPHDISLLAQAYSYPTHLQALHQLDSPLRKIMEWMISLNPNGFIDYFSYCFAQTIIDEDVFVNLMLFYLNSGYTDKYNLRQNAIDSLVKYNLLDKINSPEIHPQTLPIYYTAPYPSAPPVDGGAGSYYYLYTTEASMIPTITPPPPTSLVSPPALEPVYLPVTNKPAPTPTSSAAAPVKEQQEEEEISYFTGIGLYYGRVMY